MVATYCLSCHNNKLKTAGLSLEGLDAARVGDDSGTWEKVLRKVAANQMPPGGLPSPNAGARKAFTAYLETELDRAAAAHPNPGYPTVHRLNRNEYSNAIRDLLALDIHAGSSLPVDDTGYGFDNIGDVLSLSPILTERYMSVARSVARLAVGDVDVKPTIDTFAAPRDVNAVGAGRRPHRVGQTSEDLPFDSNGGLSFQYMFPVDAEYVFKIKMAVPNAQFGETEPPVGQILELRAPVKAGAHHVGLTFMRSDALAETVPVFGGGRGGFGRNTAAGPLPTAYFDLRIDQSRLKLFDVPEGTPGREFNELSIGGPYSIAGPGDTPSRRKIFSCRPALAKDEEPCARKILSALARRAYRRPVGEADLKPLMAFYLKGRKERDFDFGIESALRLMLLSPDFLFRAERDPACAQPGSVHRVSDYELASRLSFFLWSSIPDDELLDLAGQGRLKDPKVVEQQVSRMLNDPKSKAFVENFPGQWLLLRSLDQFKPEPDAFPEFDRGLQLAFQRETELFFAAILRENRPVTELLDAKFTFLNERLAEFYGIPGVYGAAFRRVELTDPQRGGLLGQASILTATSYPNRTSVVLRGKWVLENLLGSPPPPPPANVPPLELRANDRKLTAREAMEAHRANPVCASCHAKMDPLGFALENFNGIGAWREKDSGAAIDPSGRLPDGSQFQGPAGLKLLLLNQHRDEFISTFTEKLMTYALGRGLEPYDRPAMRAAIRQAANRNSTIPALIESIVQSPQFQMRRVRDL